MKRAFAVFRAATLVPQPRLFGGAFFGRMFWELGLGLARLRRVAHSGDAPWARRHPCRSSHSTTPAFSLHPRRVLWCLDFRALEEVGLELTLFAFLSRASISRSTLYCRSVACPAIYGAAVAKSGDSIMPDTLYTGFAAGTRQIAGQAPLLHGLRQPDVSP